jgi:hypothetical protein
MSRVPPAVGRQDIEDALVAFSHEPVTGGNVHAHRLVASRWRSMHELPVTHEGRVVRQE